MKDRAISLLVMSRTGVYTCALPESGSLTIGRGEDCDVQINDRKVSRVHAILEVNAAAFRLVDKGSTNGTLVAGRRLDPNEAVDLGVGDMVTLGSTVLVLQSAPGSASPVRVWSEQAFTSLFETVRAKAAHDGTSFGVVQLRMGSANEAFRSTSTQTAVQEETARADRLERALRDALRPTDVVATVGSGRYEVLLPATDPEVVARLAERLGSRLREEGFACEVGDACYPRDGITLAELERRAEESLHDSQERPPPLSADFERGAMKRLAPMINRVAAGVINVLILGETGVGKEVLARTIHEKSPRAKGPLVTLNCAAVSESLLESELFGHEKGSFTGAVGAKPGLLEAAHGGTFFLDEIGEMPMALQAKLLRVLEQREVMRVGALKPRQIDVRFISATNRDLEEEIGKGRFRRDLFFRLNGISITLPPLRQRVDEIEPLAQLFLKTACEQIHRSPVPRLSPQVVELLVRYSWPGNIRELRNMIERAILLSTGNTIQIEHLPVEKLQGPVVPLRGTSGYGGAEGVTFPGSAPSVVGKATEPATSTLPPADGDEKRRIMSALERCAGNQTKAAQLLGISRRTLVTRLKEYSLPRPRKPV
jgi:DNA-binding NtrC family response regulator